MQQQEIIDLAKKKLLEKKYGMFDWVEKIISENDLVNAKPRMLRQQISMILETEIENIPYKTFHSWINRFRKNRTPYQEKHQESAEPLVVMDNHWKEFKPSNPSNKIQEKTILKKVKYEE